MAGIGSAEPSIGSGSSKTVPIWRSACTRKRACIWPSRVSRSIVRSADSGRGLDFTVDHCEGCKGIWLDRNEWEALKKRHLHDDLNSIFTSFWQTGAQREIRKKKLEEIYISRFGTEDYAEIKRIRWWLDTKTNKEELIAFLTDRDPFNA